VAAGHSQEPSIRATLCLAERAMITDLLQLSKLSPLKGVEPKVALADQKDECKGDQWAQAARVCSLGQPLQNSCNLNTGNAIAE